MFKNNQQSECDYVFKIILIKTQIKWALLHIMIMDRGIFLSCV